MEFTLRYDFPPLADKKRFPLLCSLSDQLNHALMVCDNLLFLAPQESTTANLATRLPGVEWHLYGDTRWPSGASWIEFPLTHYAFLDRGGVLVMRAELPAEETDPFGWIAANHPLALALPAMRLESTVEKIAGMLQFQASSNEVVAGPEDQRPRHVQGYCIFRQHAGDEDVQFVATYTDLLNLSGTPIPRFRMGEFQPSELSLCQFSLHALFRLNQARLAGEEFMTQSQIPIFAASILTGEAVPAKWTRFHPSRTLRTRPALRALPSPSLTNGMMNMSDYGMIGDVRRREANGHMLAFLRDARPREMGLFNTDTNSSMTAFMHRAHGGAIYVIPDRLVEEFHHTDCTEVRVGDIKLPFASVFLKFTPPQAVNLANEALVDGCYVVKQADEFLITLTARLSGVDYENSMSVACIDPIFAIHLPAADPELTINGAVELGIEEFLRSNAPPEADISTEMERPDGTIAHVVDIRARSRKQRIEQFSSQEPSFRACLNIIVNAACFITFRPDDISDAWEGEPSAEVIAASCASGDSRRTRDRRLGALRKVESGDFTRVKICGRGLFANVPQSPADGVSPRAHWRRGHWRRQRHGVGLTLIVLRWIRPTIVKKDQGPLVEARIYEV